MKLKIILFITLFFVSQIFAQPLLVVVLMVKNEAAVITQTLQPFVDGGVKEFVIFDTGSTDGTQAIAADFFKQRGIENSHIIEESFIDFATSRNHALDAAERIFPQATFMAMPDAEWYMHNVSDLLQFCINHKDDYHASYFIPIRNDSVAFCVSRLIRCRTGIRFVGAVHEALDKLTLVTLPNNIYFEWRPSQKGQEKSIKRWERDRDLLLKSHEKNPGDARTLFYLAQTYDCLGDWENAYAFYTKRAAIIGWDEENFMTRFRLGTVAERLAPQGDDSICPLAIKHYLEAFALRPSRAEPLIKIAQYYLYRDEMELAFLFAAQAAKMPYPEKDILFVEKYMYEFVRYDVLGRCAWHVGEFELGEWAVIQALKIKPDAPHLQRNLSCYIDPARRIKSRAHQGADTKQQ